MLSRSKSCKLDSHWNYFNRQWLTSVRRSLTSWYCQICGSSCHVVLCKAHIMEKKIVFVHLYLYLKGWKFLQNPRPKVKRWNYTCGETHQQTSFLAQGKIAQRQLSSEATHLTNWPLPRPSITNPATTNQPITNHHQLNYQLTNQANIHSHQNYSSTHHTPPPCNLPTKQSTKQY